VKREMVGIKMYAKIQELKRKGYKFAYFQDHPFNSEEFIKAHDLAFQFFGGRPAQIVYDQDRVMVVDENAGEIIFTEKFREYCNYAGFSVHLCRKSDPESKGKIEAVVKYVKNNFLTCRIYHGINALNSAGLKWLDRCANGRIHETTKMIPKFVFNEEKKHLKPAPTPSSPILPKIAHVRKTNVVHYRQNRYAMPKGTYSPGRKVRIEIDEEIETLKFFDEKTSEFLASHKIYQGVVKYVRMPNTDSFTENKNHELLEKVLSNFDGEISAVNHVNSIVKKYPRYAKDQLRIISKLQEEHSDNLLFKAVQYCTDRNLISATDFRDTLVYLKDEPEIQTKKKIFLPAKYRVVTADVRSLAAYENLHRGGDFE
jgi:hypothetical protein